MKKTIFAFLTFLTCTFSSANTFSVKFYGSKPNIKIVERIISENFRIKFPTESWIIFIDSSAGRIFENTIACTATVGLIPANAANDHPQRSFSTMGGREFSNTFLLQNELSNYHNECIERSLTDMVNKLTIN